MWQQQQLSERETDRQWRNERQTGDSTAVSLMQLGGRQTKRQHRANPTALIEFPVLATARGRN